MKVIRNGKVAVLYSPGYGAGWSAWIDDGYKEILLFRHRIVELVEKNKRNMITEELCQRLLCTDDPIYTGEQGISI